MAQPSALHLFARDSDPASLFRRDCLECPTIAPSCPKCSTGEVCVQISPTCQQCASRKCVSQYDSGSTATSSTLGAKQGPNVGAIAGGVIGGVAVIAIVTYLVWRFIIKNKSDEWTETFEGEFEDGPEKGTGVGFDQTGDGRASIMTRSSGASTFMTRASNVIPIAFIPGIIDRSTHQQDYSNPLVPPVPIPTSSTSQTLSPYSDQHGDTYFMPGDLRDSTYSGFSDDGASSMTGRSLTNSLLRGSMASTIYPVTTAPIQTAQRARAAVVSVKHSGATTPVPAVPLIDYEKYGRAAPQPAPTVQATPLVTLNDRTFIRTSALAASASSPLRHATVPPTSPIPTAASPTRPGQANLTAVIEDATRRASRQPTHGGLGSVTRDDSPFSDQHAIVDI